MTSVVVIFIDSLKPNNLKYMKFLDKFYKKNIRTEMGYSNTCHASMYTGVYPCKHDNWFIWYYSPYTSPFKLIKKIKINDYLNNSSYLKCALYVILQKYKNGKVLAGLPLLAMHPLNYWSYFDGNVVDPCKEPCDDIGGYPTLFKILKNNSIKSFYKFSSISDLGESLNEINLDGSDSFNYIFIGEVDTLSHKFGQESYKAIKSLENIDSVLESKFEEWMGSIEDFVFIVFSDHGHIGVKNEIDLATIFRDHNKNIYDYIFFIDSNFARFWFRNEEELHDIEYILSSMNELGYILGNPEKEKYKLSNSRKYGDIIFYLDKPNVFTHKKLILFGKDRTTSVVSMHGFSPDHCESDGVFISNREMIDSDHIVLQDFSPSVLSIFSIDQPHYFDGSALWKR